MALHRKLSTPFPLSQSHENVDQNHYTPALLGQNGPSYHVYIPTQPMQAPPLAGSSLSNSQASNQSTLLPIPALVPSEVHEDAKQAVPAKRGSRARKGRASGSQNWSAPDIIALAHYVESAVPLGMNVWKRIEALYNQDYAIPNNRQERAWDNMRDKWYKVGTDMHPLHKSNTS